MFPHFESADFRRLLELRALLDVAHRIILTTEEIGELREFLDPLQLRAEERRRGGRVCRVPPAPLGDDELPEQFPERQGPECVAAQTDAPGLEVDIPPVPLTLA